MPTIRDIAFLVLSEGIGQVVDHRAEVRADRQRFLHRREAALPRRGRRSVPVLAERPDEPGLLVPQPRREAVALGDEHRPAGPDRKSTRLNSSHSSISYAVFCLKKKNKE